MTFFVPFRHGASKWQLGILRVLKKGAKRCNVNQVEPSWWQLICLPGIPLCEASGWVDKTPSWGKIYFFSVQNSLENALSSMEFDSFL